ncbi:MAG: N-acetylmuramoyl-L-alanine amidase [Butyrivibrio sp.]|nr:N-acetylmuramoyl-L-alanine amidase [Butyrivibrio sp.]
MPKKKNKLMNSIVFLFLELVILIVIGTQVFKILTKKSNVEIAAELEIPSWIDVQLIDEGNPSRSGALLEGINDIVVHYVGNPRTTAQQNRDFYNQEDSDVCSHFVVGIDGEIIMCVPLTEKSASSNDRNRDTISIEVCHPDITGEFTDASYESLIKLVNWLRSSFNLSTDHVIRHYEVTGKECPMYFVRNPEKWDQFKEDLKAAEEGKPISYKFSGEGSEEESDELSMDDADDFTADNVDYATDEYQNDDLVYAIDDYNNYNYDEYPVEAPDEVYY